MKNFYSFNPVKVLFGNGLLDNIERELDDVERILIVHSGRSSINTNALPKTKEALSRKKIFEFTKFSENPDISDGINAIKYAREKEIEFILCIGGGSCIDFGKLICLGMYADEKNLWEILKKEHNAPNKTLPFGTVLTLPASGSEVNNALVISNKKTKEKISTFFLTLYPRFSVLDPSFTINLNKEQTALGILDMFMHTIEQYLTFPVNTPLQDRQAEAILTTLIEYGPKLLENLTDYNLRAIIMWCGSAAVNGTISRGVPPDWSMHVIGHEITALYGVRHAQTLAFVFPALFKLRSEQKKEKLKLFGKNVWKITEDTADLHHEAIIATENFIKKLGICTDMAECGLNKKEVANRVVSNLKSQNFQPVGEKSDVTLDDIYNVLISNK